jgi:hypothetical protein
LPTRITAIVALTFAIASCAAQSSQGTDKYETAPAGLSRIEQAMIAAAVDTVAAQWRDSTALCLTVMGGPEGARPAADNLLGQLRTRQRAVAGNRCPPTYRTMTSASRPTDPPPPGYVDPYRVTVSRPQFEHEGYAWIHVRQLQGTRGRAYMCVAQSYERLFVACRVIDSWIH